MIMVYYLIKDTGIRDMRIFESKEEIQEWIDRQLEVQPSTIIEEIRYIK